MSNTILTNNITPEDMVLARLPQYFPGTHFDVMTRMENKALVIRQHWSGQMLQMEIPPEQILNRTPDELMDDIVQWVKTNGSSVESEWQDVNPYLEEQPVKKKRVSLGKWRIRKNLL